MPTIEEILAERSTYLKGTGGDPGIAFRRRPLTIEIEHHNPAFEELRDTLLDGRRGTPASRPAFLSDQRATPDDVARLLDEMLRTGILQPAADQFVLPDVDAKRLPDRRLA